MSHDFATHMNQIAELDKRESSRGKFLVYSMASGLADYFSEHSNAQVSPLTEINIIRDAGEINLEAWLNRDQETWIELKEKMFKRVIGSQYLSQSGEILQSIIPYVRGRGAENRVRMLGVSLIQNRDQLDTNRLKDPQKALAEHEYIISTIQRLQKAEERY